MTKSLKLVFLLIGCLLLGWAISTIDLIAVANLIIKLGYGFIIILTIYGSVTWVDTIAWKNNFRKDETKQFNLWSLWCIRQIGEAYNTITPFGTLGGEPVKAQLLKERHGLSLKQGMASQIIARTTFLIKSDIISEKIKMTCLIAMLTLSMLILFFLIFQVTGTLGKLARLISKLPLGKKMDVFINKVELLDQGISSYYKNNILRATISVSYAFIGWHLSLTDLWLIEAVAQLIRNASFFIPLSIGAQEGGLLLIFTALGMPGALGVTVSFVRRIKEILWVCLGLALGWGTSFHPEKSK